MVPVTSPIFGAITMLHSVFRRKLTPAWSRRRLVVLHSQPRLDRRGSGRVRSADINEDEQMRRCSSRMWTLIAVWVSFVWFVPGTQAQPAGPETVVDAFVRAWNSHDAKAFGDVFSEDAHWVTASGVRVKGRGEIRSFLGKEHLTWARTTTMKAADVEVKSIGPDLAVVLFRWDIGGAADADGKAVGTFRGSTLFVAASQANRWTVVTGQVATAPSAR